MDESKQRGLHFSSALPVVRIFLCPFFVLALKAFGKGVFLK